MSYFTLPCEGGAGVSPDQVIHNSGVCAEPRSMLACRKNRGRASAQPEDSFMGSLFLYDSFHVKHRQFAHGPTLVNAC